MNAVAAGAGLGLYSAQRPLARLAKTALKMSMGTPLCAALPKINVRVDAASDLMHFICEQCDVQPPQLDSLAVLFSCRSVEQQRLVLLVCDEDRTPSIVIKAGLHPVAGALIDREADIMSALPPNIMGATRLLGRLATSTVSAFSMPYYQGETPSTDEKVSAILTSWLDYGSLESVESMTPWLDLRHACDGLKDFSILHGIISGQTIRTTIHHGDFTPWNIRVTPNGEWNVFDWERATLKGLPGWDWFHFVMQKEILVKRCSSESAADRIDALIESEPFQEYAERAGINQLARPLLLAYLLRQKWIIKPEDGAAVTSGMYDVLARRWRLADGLPRPAAQSKPAQRRENTGWAGSGLRAFARNESPLGPQPTGIMHKLKRLVPATWLDMYRQMNEWLWTPRKRVVQGRVGFFQQMKVHLSTVIVSYLILAGLVAVHTVCDPRFTLLPFYLIPCAMLTLLINWRWGSVAALISSVVGPLLLSKAIADFSGMEVMLWNSAMRFLLLEIVVLLLNRVRLEITAASHALDRTA